MPRDGAPKKSPKGKSQDMNWKDWQNPNCIAEPGWEEEPKKVWDCTTCKKYIHMTHLSKIWPKERAHIQVRRWEGQQSTCLSKHFIHRYDEVTRNAGSRDSKPNVMNYSNMAMVWAEIVLHKDVDWRTIAGRNVNNLNRKDAVIYTSWTQPSDCMPEWSNRGQFGFPAIVMPDAEDEYSDDEGIDEAPVPVTFGERHHRVEAREDIEYEQQMQEAMRRSLEDRGRHHRQNEYYRRDRDAYHPFDGRIGSQYGMISGSGSSGVDGNHGAAHSVPSSQVGLQSSSRYRASGSYGHQGSGSNDPGFTTNVSDPPPTFGGPYYGNYGQGSAPSGHGDPYGGSPYVGTYGCGSTAPNHRDDSDSGSE